MTVEWSLRPATPDDADWLADLKAAAMRSDLERLGRWRHGWARQRFLDTYVPANTRIVLVGNGTAGCVAVRPESDAVWIEHFYLYPNVQGRGLGGQVLDHVLALQHPQIFMLAVVRGSTARALYESRGFVHDHDDPNGVDQILVRRT